MASVSEPTRNNPSSTTPSSNRSPAPTTPKKNESASRSTAPTAPKAPAKDTSRISNDAKKPERSSNPFNFGSWFSRKQPEAPQSPSPAAPAAPAKASTPWADNSGTLKRGGEANDNVRGLQESLRSQGYDIKVDGKFGSQTEDAVRRYQSSHGLKEDGLVGSQTKDGLKKGLSLNDGESLKRGDDSAKVRGMQQLLQKSGAQDLEADGKFGPKTEAALRKFQESKGMQGGQLDPKTLEALKNPGAVSPSGPKTPGQQPTAPQSRPQPTAPAPAQQPTAPQAPQTQQGPRKPVDSFTFSSNPQDPERVKRLIQSNNAQGKSTLVGIDPNNNAAAQQKLARVARENGAQTHLYLEGRGGPTGNSGWEKGEWERTKRAAANLQNPIHLTSQSDNSPAMREWNNRGWQEHSIKQAREAKRNGHSSVEVDNINRLDSGDNTKRTMDFYRQYASEYAKGDMPTLMMKNQTVSELKAVQQAMSNYDRTRNMTPEQVAALPEAIRNNRIPREMFSDYHIYENDSGSLTARHLELTRAMGIKLLQSKDTHNYRASGNFN